MTTLLNTAYWPNLHYFYFVLNSEEIQIEVCDNYNKQSFRNRTQILSANGGLDLIIPVVKNGHKQQTKDIEISYQEKWQTKHWRAITSAYRNSAYFEFFEEEIKYFYDTKYTALADYNTAQLKCILKILKLNIPVKHTIRYETEIKTNDARSDIHPKMLISDAAIQPILNKPYRQVFDEKFPFQPNLSILDLVFNMGLETIDYLRK